MVILRSLAAFLFTVALLCVTIPRPIPEFIDPAYHAFLREVNEVEAMFVGSSNTFLIDMEVFEAEAERLGQPTRSLNVGVPGMWMQEAEVFLERLLRQDPKRLRWIFIDMAVRQARNAREGEAEYEPVERPGRRQQQKEQRLVAAAMGLTQRDVWMHTPRIALQQVLLGRKAQADSSYYRRHLKLGLQRAIPLGLGFDYLAVRSAPEHRHSPFWAEGEAEQRFMTESEYEAHLASIDEDLTHWDRELNARYLRAQSRRLRKRGYTVIFLVHPQATPGALASARELKEMLPAEEIWSFADPAQYPELFDWENRSENVHLNRSGNEIYARLLAERFAAYRGGSAEGTGARQN